MFIKEEKKAIELSKKLTIKNITPYGFDLVATDYYDRNGIFNDNITDKKEFTRTIQIDSYMIITNSEIPRAKITGIIDTVGYELDDTIRLLLLMPGIYDIWLRFDHNILTIFKGLHISNLYLVIGTHDLSNGEVHNLEIPIHLTSMVTM